jgi:hypothetical protein
MTFRACAERYIAAHEASWKNAAHAAQWPSSLENYVYPVFGDLSASATETALVVKVLEPIWSTKTKTASRVRGRIETVLDWAKTVASATARTQRDGKVILIRCCRPRGRLPP